MLWLVKGLVTPSFGLSMSRKQSLWALYGRLGRSPNYCHRDSVQNEPKCQDYGCLDTLSEPALMEHACLLRTRNKLRALLTRRLLNVTTEIT
jgi:hypothetical protein